MRHLLPRPHSIRLSILFVPHNQLMIFSLWVVTLSDDILNVKMTCIISQIVQQIKA